MKSRKLSLALGLASLFAISLVLRPPVAVIGPLLPELKSSLNRSTLELGLLSAAPVLCFGIGAFASVWLVKRFGLRLAMFLMLIALTLSMGFRVFGGFISLLIGTLVAGLAIAVANVLLPTIVRVDHPKRVAILTGGYTTVLALSASFAASIAVPSSLALGGWVGALAIWTVPGVLAVVLWFTQLRVSSSGHAEPKLDRTELKAEAKAVTRSPITWSIVIFFGIQSLGFYAVLNWLPSILIREGSSASEAGALLGLATFVGVPSGLLMSGVYSKIKNLGPIGLGISLVTASGFAFLLAGSQFTITACVLLGLGQAATFPLSLSLISTRASTQSQTTVLSSTAQGYGYLLAAVGTFLVGFLSDLTGSWSAGILMLLCLTILQAASVLIAGRPKSIPASSPL
jgi:CP family cyanate transporter-like MFS transporter